MNQNEIKKRMQKGWGSWGKERTNFATKCDRVQVLGRRQNTKIKEKHETREKEKHNKREKENKGNMFLFVCFALSQLRRV